MAPSAVTAALSLLLLLVSPSTEAPLQLPEELKKCKIDETINDCLKDALQDAVPIFVKGIRELGVLPIDPLAVTELVVPQGNGPVSVSLRFSNFHMTGLGSMKIDAIRFDTENYGFEAELHMESPISLQGAYSVDGQVLVLPIKGSGDCNITLEDVAAVGKIEAETFDKDGENYIRAKKVDFTFETKRLHLDFQNLFDGNAELGDNMNKFLNDNWDEVLKEVQEPISAALGASFQEIANRVFEKVPVDNIFLRE